MCVCVFWWLFVLQDEAASKIHGNYSLLISLFHKLFEGSSYMKSSLLVENVMQTNRKSHVYDFSFLMQTCLEKVVNDFSENVLLGEHISFNDIIV